MATGQPVASEAHSGLDLIDDELLTTVKKCPGEQFGIREEGSPDPLVGRQNQIAMACRQGGPILLSFCCSINCGRNFCAGQISYLGDHITPCRVYDIERLAIIRIDPIPVIESSQFCVLLLHCMTTTILFL